MKIADAYKEIEIYIDTISLKGKLRLCEQDTSKGLVLFSNAKGSSRLSVRNNYVANLLLENGYSSLLFDLLTTEEDFIYENRFDTNLLTERLLKVTKWAKNYKYTKHLPIGYFGVSTGAAAALNAATYLGNKLKAVVCCGGRPDLVTQNIQYITAPTQFIVGGNNQVILEINKQAQTKFICNCEIKIVDEATHLFTNPITLEIVVNYTTSWFDKYLS
jgi:dienelactone hydrolase